MGGLGYIKRLAEIQWRSSLHILLSSSPPLAAGAIPRIPAFQRSVGAETARQRGLGPGAPRPARQETPCTERRPERSPAIEKTDIYGSVMELTVRGRGDLKAGRV